MEIDAEVQAIIDEIKDEEGDEYLNFDDVKDYSIIEEDIPYGF